MKNVRYDGPGARLVVGDTVIERGKSAKLSDDDAAALQKQSHIRVRVTNARDTTKTTKKTPPAGGAQPAADTGEGQTTSPDEKE